MAPSGAGEPDRSERLRLGTLLAAHKPRIALLASSSAAGGLVEAVFLVAVTRAAFAITEGRSTFTVIAGIEMTPPTLVVAALALVVLRVSLAVVSAWAAAHLGASVVATMRRQIASSYLEASWSTQHGERGGRLQELLTTFANQGAVLVNATTQGIVAICTLVALLLIAVVVDPLSSFAVIVAVVTLSSVLRPLRSAVRRQAKRASDSGMEFATGLSEMSQLGMEMHVFNVQPAMRDRVVDLIDDNANQIRRVSYLRGLVPVIYSGLAYAALVVALALASAIDSTNLETVGAVMLVMLRSLTYGQALQSHFALANSSLPFLDALNTELTRYRDGRVIDHGEPVGSVGPLNLRSVSFEYPAGVVALRDISAEIEPHEVVGIVGPSGSGKSTLVQVLLGLRTPTAGQALAGNREIGRFSRLEWARKVTYVPQHPHLINGTVSDNIRFLRPGVSQADIERAARMAQLHDDVTGFPGGYDQQVGDQGSQLSGGQQQRLIIARALVEEPDVLVLDEPTSALDVRSEALIRDTLDRLRERMTVIIIAHRLSTLDICDRIMVIQDGRLMGFDSPTELEQSSEFYRESMRLSGRR